MSEDSEARFARIVAESAHPANYTNDAAYRNSVDAEKTQRVLKDAARHFPMLCAAISRIAEQNEDMRSNLRAESGFDYTVTLNPEFTVQMSAMDPIYVLFKGKETEGLRGIRRESPPPVLVRHGLFGSVVGYHDREAGEAICAQVDEAAARQFMEHGFGKGLMPVPRTIYADGRISLASPMSGGPVSGGPGG